MEDDVFKLLLPAAEIPDGATVSKRTGEAEYVLKTSLKIFAGKTGTTDQVIKAHDGAVFLVSPNGSINAYPGTTLIHWIVGEDELFRWLEERREGTPQ